MFGLYAIIDLIEGVITFTLGIFVFKADNSLFTLAEDSLSMRSNLDLQTDQPPQYRFPIWATISTVAVFGAMSIFSLIASENPDGLESTFERISNLGYNLNILKTGFFGFPEGLGWAILQMAIIMIIIFLLILGINFLVYLVKKNRYNRILEENEIKSLCGDEQIEEKQSEISTTEKNIEKESPVILKII